jgi:hypothetical protein
MMRDGLAVRPTFGDTTSGQNEDSEDVERLDP